jgi:uncharacterized membrane protein
MKTLDDSRQTPSALQPDRVRRRLGPFWSALISLIFLMPLAGAAIGAVSGALGGALADARAAR